VASTKGREKNRVSLVFGNIVFNPQPDPGVFHRMVIYIYLEDISYADAPAQVITNVTIDQISQESRGNARVPFAIRSIPPEGKGRYSLRVHADVDGDGKVSRGDYITKTSYPVRIRGSPQRIEVRVEVVE
jgi:uncharacterized lipoprotein YbaY